MSEPTTEDAKPAIAIETPQEKRLEVMTPAERAELLAKSEELRRTATAIEARRQEALTMQAKEEAETANVQERINVVLGTHNILDTVRQESAALHAIYAKQLETVNATIKSVEAKLHATVPAPEVPAPSPETPMQETSESPTPNATQESATISNPIPDHTPANDTTPPPAAA